MEDQTDKPDAKIWLMEPELILRHFLIESLMMEWPQSRAFGSVYDLNKALAHHVPDVLIMEVSLKYDRGLEYCSQWRVRCPTLPILVLSARQSLDDRVACLQAGADLFLAKPVECEELVAYVKSSLNRSRRWLRELPTDPRPVQRRRRRGGLLLAPDQQDAQWNQQSLGLTSTEFALLWALSQTPGEVCSRQALSAQLWPGELARERHVDQFVKRLRQKLPDSSNCQLSIDTVYGRGYRLQVAASR